MATPVEYLVWQAKIGYPTTPPQNPEHCDAEYDNPVRCGVPDSEIYRKWKCVTDNTLLFNRDNRFFEESFMMWEVGNTEKLLHGNYNVLLNYYYLCVLLFLNWYEGTQGRTYLTDAEKSCLSKYFACQNVDFDKLLSKFE